MSVISKTITLRVPLNIVCRGLKDTRLEELFPEYFTGVQRKLIIDKENKEIIFQTTTQESPIQIIEKFVLIISDCRDGARTDVEYVTETNAAENDLVVQSIVQTHIANMLYSLLMIETGYIKGLIEKGK